MMILLFFFASAITLPQLASAAVKTTPAGTKVIDRGWSIAGEIDELTVDDIYDPENSNSTSLFTTLETPG